MKRVIIILFALLPIFAAAQNEGSNDGLINKGSGILYFEGRPSFDPTPFTDASEFAIDLNTKKVYVYSGSGSVWNRYNAIDTLSTLADTSNVDNRIGQLTYVNGVDQFWTVNSAGSWEVLSGVSLSVLPAQQSFSSIEDDVLAGSSSIYVSDEGTISYAPYQDFQNIKDYDGFVYMTEKQDGEILMAYRAGISHVLGGDIRLKNSTDNGKTWTNDRLFLSGRDYGGAIVDHIGNDSIIIIYKDLVQDSNWWQLSIDGGDTWQGENDFPEYAPWSPYYGPWVEGHGVYNWNGAAGTWIIPVFGKEGPTTGTAGVAKTTDYGATWNFYFYQVNNPSLDESGLVVIGDSIVSFIRSENTGEVLRSASADGETWTIPVNVSPNNSGSGKPAPYVAEDGTVLLAGRSNFTNELDTATTFVAYSTDNGFTWDAQREIRKDGGYMYGDIIEIDPNVFIYVGGVDTNSYNDSYISSNVIGIKSGVSSYIVDESNAVVKTDGSGSITPTEKGGTGHTFLGPSGSILVVNQERDGYTFSEPISATFPEGEAGQTITKGAGNWEASSFLKNDGTSIQIGLPPSGVNTKLDVNDKIRIRGVATSGTGTGTEGIIFDRQDNTDQRYNSISYQMGPILDSLNWFKFNLHNGSMGSPDTRFELRYDTSIFHNSVKTLSTLQVNELPNNSLITGLVGKYDNNILGEMVVGGGLEVSSGNLRLNFNGTTPTAIVGRDASRNLSSITIGQNMLFSSGTLNPDTTNLYLAGVTSFLGGGTDSFAESVRFSRPNPNQNSRYHSIFTSHSGTESENAIRFSVHNGVTASPSSQVVPFQMFGDGTVDILTGLKINSTATSGNYLRGNGTNFVSSTIQESDLPTRPISDITGLTHNVTTATTDASGDIVVTHGLGATPTTVLITGGTNDNRTYQVLEASKTSTTFTVRVYDAGSLLVSSSATFNWIAIE